MRSDVTLDRENGDAVSSLPSNPTTTLEYSRSISQDLRYFDDALTHAIDQLTTFNSETMSDLSLKYELMRNNESRVIGFFARQLMLLKKEKSNGQNGGFHSEYSKIDRFLTAINLNEKSIEYISQRITFDDLLNKKTAVNEHILIDAGLTETERKDFHNAHSALKACIEYFSNGGMNHNGRFYWHTEIPMSTSSDSTYRLSDTAHPTAPATETIRSASVSSSKSTDFEATADNQPVGQASPHTRKHNRTSNLLSNNDSFSKIKYLFSISYAASISGESFMCKRKSNTNSSRNTDLQLPSEGNSSRRNSYGSDSESRLPSELQRLVKNQKKSRSRQLVKRSATPKSPTVRSPALSNSPLGSAQNSDAENDTRIPEAVMYNTSSPILRHRLAHIIQHKYKCHKECVQHAPANCGLSEILLRRAIESNDFQNIHANSSPMSRKYPFAPWDNISPTASTPISAPESPALNPTEPGYFKPTMCISESLYSTQNDPDSWVVIEATSKNASEIPEAQSDTDTNATIQTDSGTNLTDSTSTTH
ncbi:unnamed protein product, partial [Rotaria socialis]